MKYKAKVKVIVPRIMSGEVENQIKTMFVDRKDIKKFGLLGGVYEVLEV